MAKYRVTTHYTACIDMDVMASSEKEAIEKVRCNKEPINQEYLRKQLDDIQESWTEHRTAWELPIDTHIDR